jgi:zinc transporter 2
MRILHQGEGGYHMGGGSCSHDHGDGGGHDHDHGHSHGDGGDCAGHSHDHSKGEEGKESKCEHSHAEGEEHTHDHAHDHADEEPKQRRNINVDAAFLHALGDMIMSIGVCTAATIIYFQPTWVIADPVCTFVFSVIVCVTVTPIVKGCIAVLMEGSPTEIDTDELIRKI